MASWIVNMRVVHYQDFYVEAESEEQACEKAMKLDSEEGQIGEMVDWEICNVEPNK